MAGRNDPIQLTKEQFDQIRTLEAMIDDFQFELARARTATIDVKEREAELATMKRQLAGIKRVYAPT